MREAGLTKVGLLALAEQLAEVGPGRGPKQPGLPSRGHHRDHVATGASARGLSAVLGVGQKHLCGVRSVRGLSPQRVH